jgi:hypothetical protein
MKTQALLAVFLLLLVAVLPLPNIVRTAQSQGGPPVVINEVAWAGTAANARDEWIELRNNTVREIDLTGWTLRWSEGEDEIIIHFGAADENTKEVRRTVIPARGFYLLERTDDEAVRDIEADLIYTGTLRNDGETLTLTDAAGKVIDVVNEDGGEWPAGTDSDGEPPYASMERIDPTAAGTDDNWGSNDGVIRAGEDANGDPINGTPKAENSRKKTG